MVAGRRRATAAVLTLLSGLAAAPVQSQGVPSGLSAIAQAAAQRGVVRCLGKIDKLARVLAEKHDIGVFIFNDLAGPDTRTVSISMELSPSPSGGSAYASATFTPNAFSGCEVLVESVLYWSSKCTAVGLAYPGYASTGPLLGDIEVRAPTGSARLFLMPAGTGCISVEKSVYY